MSEQDTSVAVVGLGYVGLPLAIAFGSKIRTYGFDIDPERVAVCKAGSDPNGEVDAEQFAKANKLSFTHDSTDIKGAGYFVVAVPTPVDRSNRPDFSCLVQACRTVGSVLKPGATVVFESTVYPGATQEVCVPELERASGKQNGKDFFVAYSPERVNPGDREHTLEKITKLVAADDPATLARVAGLYEMIVPAGIYRVDSIKVAEAAKVIENTQRDLNIALVNELAIIFDRMGLDTSDVLAAASTKWNFLPFRPGLVGGHCIGVDPYYLTYKAQACGYQPHVILAGRRINDGMGKYIAEQTVKTMLSSGIEVHKSTVNILGVTFKENCPDLRNSQVFKIIEELKSYGLQIHLHDPVAEERAAYEEYGATLSSWEELPVADVIVLAVSHKQFIEMPQSVYKEKLNNPAVVIDVKSVFDKSGFGEGVTVWRL